MLAKHHKELLNNVVFAHGTNLDSAQTWADNLGIKDAKVFNREKLMKYIDPNWTEYEFNDTIKNAVDISQQALDAIELLSEDQQGALKLAGSIVECIKRLTVLETNINGYAFAEMTEDDYEIAKEKDKLEDNKIYFVFEKQPDIEPDDDFE